MTIKKISMLIFLLMISIACVATNGKESPTQAPLGPPQSFDTKVILQRLKVDFLGQDGHYVIGSGCPGNDGKGSIENYHFVVQGGNIDRIVQRVLVAGDNSTLTWEWPCTDAWGLLAQDAGGGTWDVFIAPSLPAEMYTVIFFYEDNSIALGMVDAP